MNESPEIYTIAKECTGQYKERGSRFLAFGYPVTNEDSVKQILKNLRKEYHDARHHCYAYRLGTVNISFRSNDDGEPSGTGGKPILGQLISKNLSNVLLVVVRYFGGKLLGTSGLINAYRSATADCLSNAEIYILKEMVHAEIRFTYEQMNGIIRILNEVSAIIESQTFSESCQLMVSIDKKKYQSVYQRLTSLKDVTVTTL